MKRVLFILPFAFSPAFAVGFWVNTGGGLNAGGPFTECIDSYCFTGSPKGSISGGDVSFGVSLVPALPFAGGIGADFYAGRMRILSVL